MHTNGPKEIFSEKKIIFDFKASAHHFFIPPKGSP